MIYGAGGSIGGTVARAFAREGARVFLTGRNEASLEAVAEDIHSHGGEADTAIVDALDEQAVNDFVDAVVEETGRLDVSFNLVTYGDVQEPLMEISADDFTQPITTATRTQFLTTRAAARYMIEQGSGVILTFGGGGPQTPPGLGGFKVSLDALESLRRQWAVELGPSGIRVVTLKTGGIPESIPEDIPGREEIIRKTEANALLDQTATLSDVGEVAAFVASDRARTITGTPVNISCGALVD
ncbi:SDR family NAD(P)-dependent oxidoreductase [Haladaptatus sp. NG-SE-30]